jgi:hypothetical protein
MVEVAQSYEMVRNFNNFKGFVCDEKLEVLLILVEKCLNCLCQYGKNVLTMLMLVRKIFLTSHPPPPPPPPPPPRRVVDNIFGKNFYDLVKILRKVGQNMTTPPFNNLGDFAVE